MLAHIVVLSFLMFQVTGTLKKKELRPSSLLAHTDVLLSSCFQMTGTLEKTLLIEACFPPTCFNRLMLSRSLSCSIVPSFPPMFLDAFLPISYFFQMIGTLKRSLMKKPWSSWLTRQRRSSENEMQTEMASGMGTKVVSDL